MTTTEIAAIAREWQPIETAPKDGNEILIFGGTFSDDNDWTDTDYPFSDCAIVRWVSAFGGGSWEGKPNHSHDDYRRHKPTHWMPLPPPPAHLEQSSQ